MRTEYHLKEKPLRMKGECEPLKDIAIKAMMGI